MRNKSTTTPTWRARRSTRQLLILISAAVLLAMIGTCLVGQLVLYVLMPHGALYQHNLLSRLRADYHAWEIGAIPLIPPPNAQAVLAAERDNSIFALDSAVVPVAILVPAAPIAPILSSPTPTARPTPTPQPVAPAADPSPDSGDVPTTSAATLLPSATASATIGGSPNTATPAPTRIPPLPSATPQLPVAPTNTITCGLSGDISLALMSYGSRWLIAPRLSRTAVDANGRRP